MADYDALLAQINKLSAEIRRDLVEALLVEIAES